MRKFIMMSICLACISCKVDFDFSGLESEPILYLDMNLAYDHDEGDYFLGEPFRLSGYIYAVPAVSGERELPDDLHCRVDVYRNSELIDTRDFTLLPGFEEFVSASIFDLDPGDELKVVAEADGFPTATSMVKVPLTPPMPVVSYIREDESTLRIKVTVEDDPMTEDCYAFTFHSAAFYGGDVITNADGWPMELSFGNTDETSFLDLGPFDVIWQDGNIFYGMSDHSFNGQTKTFEVNAACELPAGEGAENYHYYKVGIHKISPERLRYEAACQNKDNNVLSFIGLAPSTFAYTNITGGTGCLSCSNVLYTDWTKARR